MQITFKELSELSGVSIVSCRTYMSSWRLTKYLKMKFIKRGQMRRKLFVINFTEKFIEDFAEFMKIKAYDDKDFKKKAKELIKNVIKFYN